MGESWPRRAARRVIPRGLRHVLQHPGAAAGAAWHGAAYALGYAPRCAVTPDWEVRCHPRTLVSFRANAEMPECRDELAGFTSRCRPGMVLLDIGSHYGVFTLAALHYGGPAARVWAVDPSPRCHRLLAANLRLAGAADRVVLVSAAVGEADGSLAMLPTGAHSHDFFIATAAPRPDAVRVPQVTLNTLAARVGVPVTHLKIDVEGFEDAVIAGGREFLMTARPLLFLELHGDLLRAAKKDPAAVLADLAACGYRRFELGGKPVGADELARAPLARVVCLPEGAV